MKKYDIKTTDTETLKKWYHLMVLGRALDEKAPSYLLQSLGWSYHAPYAGHDGIQLAVGQVFTKGEDFLFPGEFYQFNLSSCIRQQNSLTAQFVSFSLSNLANIFYPPQFLQ